MTVPALQAIQTGNFLPVVLKDGRQAKLVVGNNQEDTEGRVTAFDENNNEIGHVQYTKVEDEQGNRFNPHTVVDENYRRLGLATAMYDAAEQIGGAAIPALDQQGQIRSEEGQAFRESREQKKPSTALVPVSGETLTQVRKENHIDGIDLDEWAEDGQLWDGATYYAGTVERYGKNINQRKVFPAALVPITTLDEIGRAHV